MDAFETLVSELLWAKGYWVQTSVRVNLTKEEKKDIGRKTSPRWELDVVAYKGGTNELLVIECKSFLDSAGVGFDSFKEPIKKNRYKLFVDNKLRNTVFNRLKMQFSDLGACRKDVNIKLALAAGKIKSDGDRSELEKYFEESGWLLFDEKWLKCELHALARGGYENQISSVVAKLLLRDRPK